jgi:hypothetical protein
MKSLLTQFLSQPSLFEALCTTFNIHDSIHLSQIMYLVASYDALNNHPLSLSLNCTRQFIFVRKMR